MDNGHFLQVLLLWYTCDFSLSHLLVPTWLGSLKSDTQSPPVDYAKVAQEAPVISSLWLVSTFCEEHRTTCKILGHLVPRSTKYIQGAIRESLYSLFHIAFPLDTLKFAPNHLIWDIPGSDHVLSLVVLTPMSSRLKNKQRNKNTPYTRKGLKQSGKFSLG